MRSWNALLVMVVAVAVAPASAQRAADKARATCTAITQANADASAGTVNIHHDGTPIAGTRALLSSRRSSDSMQPTARGRRASSATRFRGAG